MRKLGSLLLSVIFLCTTFLCAADETAKKMDTVNFSGEWKFNAEKSEPGEGGGRGPRASSKLVVNQDATKINIERTGTGRDGEEVTRKEEITLDGKENEVEGFRGNPMKVTAKWSDDGKTLTISSLMVFERDGNEMEIKSTEVWNLKEDGKLLAIESTRTSPRGDRNSKLAYDKVE